jgi:hypothetical protein
MKANALMPGTRAPPFKRRAGIGIEAAENAIKRYVMKTPIDTQTQHFVCS